MINDSFEVISDNHVSAISEDYTGNIWFGTTGDGIYSLSKDFRFHHSFQNVYTGKILHAKVKNGNAMYINNSGSLFEIRNYKSREVYKNKSYTGGDKNFLVAGNFLITDSMDYILIDGENGLIIPRADKSVSQKQTFNLNLLSIKEIFHDGNNLIVGSSHALTSFDYVSLIKHGLIRETKFNIRQKPGDQRIYGRDVDPQTHSLWFSQEKALYELRNGQQIEKPAFKNITFRQFEFFKDHIVGLDEDNKLIISKSYNDALAPEKIVSKGCTWSHIYQIDQTHAIISTNNYYRLLTINASAPNSRPDYTIQTIEDPFVPLRAECIAGDSISCYFFKNSTVTQIATHLLFKKIAPPIPLFSGFKTSTGSYPIAKEINVRYSESNSISISFDIISFIAKDLTCQYSMSNNGHDTWREISGNEINLNTPVYGTYTVKIRAKTLSSPYSQPAVLTIHVEKPYWDTWWFITLSVLIIFGIIWGIVSFITWRRLLRKQKEHDADMKYQQSEYKALNALMNPHFIFNSLNNIQGLINKDDKRTANQYLVIFSDLIRQNMHNISKGFISLKQELTLVENYLNLEKLRFKNLVNYEISIAQDIEVDDIMIPPLMIQPLVENAVKYGLLPRQSVSGKVWINVYERENLLYIIIEDNGVGLAQSLKSQNRLHESFGLSNLKKRTEHLKKIQQREINIEVTELKENDGSVKGTRAVVTMTLE